jgi:hypothetical protein
MGDATHVNVPNLETAGTDMVAGYVTGSPDIQWTPADWGRFPLETLVTIDQGGNGSPVPSADVRDVEAGAWTVGGAVITAGWAAPRPTIYCSLATLPALAAAGWQGDVWVADWTLTPPAAPPPMPPGMTCVAVQYSDQGGGGTYDLSVVFDPTWPDQAITREAPMLMIGVAGTAPIYLLSGSKMSHIVDSASYNAFVGAGIGTVNVTAGELAQLLADFPPGNPAITVDSVIPVLTLAGTIEAAS